MTVPVVLLVLGGFPRPHRRGRIETSEQPRTSATVRDVSPVLTDLLAVLPEELFTSLLQAPGVRIERIVSHGHKSPNGFWYDQPTGEWVVVLKGAAKIELEDKTVEMGPGDYLDIPAHTKHRVAWTTPDEPTIWLAVHYGEKN